MEENKKMNLNEATLKALSDELKNINDNQDEVDGIMDSVIVITDPEVSKDEYQEIIDKAQEIVEDTPEGEIPFDEEYLGGYLQTCPLCGSSFIESEILHQGDTCPICLGEPESFIVKGRLEGTDTEDLHEEEKESEDAMKDIGVNEEDFNFEDEDLEEPEEDEFLEKEVASKEVPVGNKLEEDNKKIIREDYEDFSDLDLEELQKLSDQAQYLYDCSVDATSEFLQSKRQIIGKISDMIDSLYEEAKSYYKVEESKTDEELVKIKAMMEDAESIEELQDIIYMIENDKLENEVQLAFDQCVQDNDELDTFIDFCIVTLVDNSYLID